MSTKIVDFAARGCIIGKGTLIGPTIMNGRLSEMFRKPCQERYVCIVLFVCVGALVLL